jgi:hypothetical protein
MPDAEAKKFDPNEVGTQHFSLPADADNFMKLVGTLNANCADMVRFNFDPEKDFPEQFDGLVLPLSKQEKVGDETKNVTKIIVVAAIPSFDALNAHSKGMDFVRDAVVRQFANKLGTAFRPRVDGKAAASVPHTVEDFIENRREASAEAWKKVGPVLVGALRKKGLVTITQAILRKCLASTPFAKATYTNIPQEQWQGVLNVGKAIAGKMAVDASIFDNWAEMRDQVTAEAVEVNDLSIDLDKLVIGTPATAAAA